MNEREMIIHMLGRQSVVEALLGGVIGHLAADGHIITLDVTEDGLKAYRNTLDSNYSESEKTAAVNGYKTAFNMIRNAAVAVAEHRKDLPT